MVSQKKVWLVHLSIPWGEKGTAAGPRRFLYVKLSQGICEEELLIPFTGRKTIQGNPRKK